MSLSFVYGESLGQGSLIQLTPTDSFEYMRGMHSRSSDFKRLHDEFSNQGFQFYFERAKVYLYAALSESGLSPNIIGILPSFVITNASDPFHLAVGITVHHTGGAIAGSVRVEHNPFTISEFTVHELNPNGHIVSTTIKADELESMRLEDIVEQMGMPHVADHHKVPREVDRKNAPTTATVPVYEQATLVAAFFEEVSRDKYVRSLYPPSGLQALIAQTPLMQKFASVNYLRFRAAFYPGYTPQFSLCTSSSSSCNICTSTSTSVAHVEL